MDEKRQTKLLVIAGFVFLICSFLLKCVGDRSLGLIGLSAWSGLHYTIIVSVVLLMLGLISLDAWYSGKMVFLFFVVFMLLPNDLFANVYQSTFAEGIYALEYNQHQSNCQYSSSNSKNLDVKCTLFFVNHSNKPISFHVSEDPSFDKKGLETDDIKNINLKEQLLHIGPHQQKAFEMDFQQPIKLNDTEHINGTIGDLSIKIIGKGNTRKL